MNTVTRVAATLVLLREGAGGDEVLLLERPGDRGSFAGAWVFPGGAVESGDEADDGVVATARRAAVRETFEETGLVVDGAGLATLSRWTPPEGAPKRFDTWFFLARGAAGELVLDPREIASARWISPADALSSHADGALTLWPPTWVTLHGLARGTAVSDPPPHFSGRFGPDRLLIWSDDIAFADDSLLDRDGPRHRLDMSALPWRYEHSL